jgi:uncharacterized protein (UPF0305 family)
MFSRVIDVLLTIGSLQENPQHEQNRNRNRHYDRRMQRLEEQIQQLQEQDRRRTAKDQETQGNLDRIIDSLSYTTAPQASYQQLPNVQSQPPSTQLQTTNFQHHRPHAGESESWLLV